MGSIKQQQVTGVAPAALHATTEKLQELFAIRLQSERVHFVTLSAALARAEESPSGIFDDLTFRAHRLKGAAATFEFARVASAAGALEKASHAAASSHARHTDAGVWDALVALVQLLGALDGNTGAMPNLETVRPAD